MLFIGAIKSLNNWFIINLPWSFHDLAMVGLEGVLVVLIVCIYYSCTLDTIY